jgi:transposase
LERKFKDLTPAERKKARDEQAKPLLTVFWKWVDESLMIVLPKSKVGEALAYALNRKSDLETYLEDGNCAISNNP